MPTLQNSRTTRSARVIRFASVVSAAALLCAACGADDVQVAEQTSTSIASVNGDGPEYGDSLDEFGEAVGAHPGAEIDSVVDDAPPGYTTIEWNDLVAPGYSDDEIWARYEDRLDAAEYGSPEANAIYEEMQAEYEDVASANATLDGQQIQLAGFVAPLSYEEDVITEFLLVPYYGACIHVPPPPPNQTIMVTLDEGMDLSDSYGAIMATGTLTLDTSETDLATASFTLTNATSRVHTY